MVLDRRKRDAQLFADFTVRKSFDMAHAEHLSAFGRKRFDRRIDLAGDLLRVEFTDDFAVVGIVMGITTLLDLLRHPRTVGRGIGPFLQGIERCVVNRAEQVALERTVVAANCRGGARYGRKRPALRPPHRRPRQTAPHN